VANRQRLLDRYRKVRARRHAAGRARALCGAAALVTGIAVPFGGAALAQAPAVEACLAANQGLSLGARLTRSAARLKAGGPLRVVAIGSSSTTGFGTWGSASTYPEAMRREFAALRPAIALEIVNSGRIGETIPANMARFERDVFARRPDLVVWQLGTNDIAWGGGLGGLQEQVIQGVRALKASGADVVLMDLQYSPMILAASGHAGMQALIAQAARQERVGLFPRFALMRRAIDAGLAPGALVWWDGLHNSAEGYECVGRALARALHAAAR
jgi:acyl-CoA thioesterase-1